MLGLTEDQQVQSVHKVAEQAVNLTFNQNEEVHLVNEVVERKGGDELDLEPEITF